MKKEISINLYQGMFLAGMLLFFYPTLTIAQQAEPVQSHAYLADLLNTPSFDGFLVDESPFRITSSMVLPRSPPALAKM